MGRNPARWAALAILLAVVAILAVVTTLASRSFGSPTSVPISTQQQPRLTPTAGAMTACAKVGTPITIPPEFGIFPLPPGTIIDTLTDQLGSIVMSGVAPYDLDSISGFFERDMPPSGFKMLQRESEPGKEVEASFKGNGHTGRWRARPIANCPGVALLTISVAR